MRDLMLSRPKTTQSHACVGEVRALFENTHVVVALLTDDVRYAGAIERADIPSDMPDEAPARRLARFDHETIGLDAQISEALERLEASGGRRLIVVDADGVTVSGLLCLKRSRRGFCVDRFH